MEIAFDKNGRPNHETAWAIANYLAFALKTEKATIIPSPNS
jgi:hypothetical protein